MLLLLLQIIEKVIDIYSKIRAIRHRKFVLLLPFLTRLARKKVMIKPVFIYFELDYKHLGGKYVTLQRDTCYKITSAEM